MRGSQRVRGGLSRRRGYLAVVAGCFVANEVPDGCELVALVRSD